MTDSTPLFHLSDTVRTRWANPENYAAAPHAGGAARSDLPSIAPFDARVAELTGELPASK